MSLCKHDLPAQSCTVCRGDATPAPEHKGQARRARAQFPGRCALNCGEGIEPGDPIVLVAPDEVVKWAHEECAQQHGIPEREKAYQ